MDNARLYTRKALAALASGRRNLKRQRKRWIDGAEEDLHDIKESAAMYHSSGMEVLESGSRMVKEIHPRRPVVDDFS